jgi:hypothetical protein
VTYVPHWRITWGGVLGPAALPAEIWKCSVAVGIPGGGVGGAVPSRADLNVLANLLRDTWASQMHPVINNACRLTACRIARIGTDGRTPKDETGAFRHGDSAEVSQPGAGPGDPYPPQVTLALSLNSPLEDLCGRGRFFVPLPGIALQGDLRLSETSATSFANRGRALVNAVNGITQPADLGVVVIASQGSATRGIPPANRVVVSVGCGRVYDTIRSRRSALDEAHVEVAL